MPCGVIGACNCASLRLFSPFKIIGSTNMNFDKTGKKNCYNCKKKCALGLDVIKFIETVK